MGEEILGNKAAEILASENIVSFLEDLLRKGKYFSFWNHGEKPCQMQGEKIGTNEMYCVGCYGVRQC